MFDCFEFYKDIGYICSSVQFSAVYAGKWPFLSVALDDIFRIYSAEELKLVQVSTPHNGKITHISAIPGCVFTTTEKSLRVTNIKDNSYQEIELKTAPEFLLSIGSYVIVTQKNVFACYDAKTLENVFEIDVERQITAIMHPNTYKNKLVVATDDGKFSIWNINSQMCIYTFNGFDSVVKLIKQSTFVDVLAFALYDGRIVFHNIKQDMELFSFQMPSTVNDMSFRLDGPPHLAVGMENGNLLIWDLKLKQIIASRPNCHNQDISSVCFLKTNLLITGSGDNTIKQWVVDDETEDILRLNRSRVGHEKPPVDIAFAEVNGVNNLITVSGTSTIIASNPLIETTSSVMSIAPLNSRYLTDPIKSVSTTNAQRFASVATQHENGTLVFLWDIENSRFSRKALTAMPQNGARIENDQRITFAEFNGKIKATCSFLSRCGNFGLVGTNEGTVELFVTQSARHKGSIEKHHSSPVVFVHSDALNQQIVSGSEDGTIYFHNFDDLSFTGYVNLPSPITKMAPHPNTHLLAITAGENVIVIDIVSHLIAREFNVKGEHLCFSNDGKYLFISNDDNVYLYDMISSSLIQSVIVPSKITGIAAEPKGNIIATIHEGSVSTKLWFFKPERINSAESIEILEAQQEGFAVFSEQPLLKLKNITNPPVDPLKFAKTKVIVPFFLQASTNMSISTPDEKETDVKLDIMPLSNFAQQLIIDDKNEDFTNSINLLINMTYDKITLEISGLHKTDDVDERYLFMKMLIFALQSHTNFEMIQGILNVFLKEFGTKILEEKELKELLNVIYELQEKAIQFLDDELDYTMYLIQMLNKIQ